MKGHMARKPSGSPTDDELRRLYTLPLGEFTAERNALAKRLQKSGDQEAADEVKSLAKPSVSAWVVNQLFTREEERMRGLLTAGEHARSALQHTLTVGDAEALREALHDQRELRDELRQSAAEILEQDVRAASQAILDRVTVNLDALALSPAAAEDAARGWLDADLEPPGFEVLAGLQLAARRPDRRGLRLVPEPERKPAAEKAPPPEKKPAGKVAGRPEPVPRRDPKADKAAAEEARRRKAEEDARTREERAEQARQEREEARLRERMERAQEKVDHLAAEADTLRRDAEKSAREAAEAERAAQEATRRAELAREDADRVSRRADRAATDLARAEKDLETARRRLSFGAQG
jgi:outer membrane biosynthesis protein TonB